MVLLLRKLQLRNSVLRLASRLVLLLLLVVLAYWCLHWALLLVMVMAVVVVVVGGTYGLGSVGRGGSLSGGSGRIEFFTTIGCDG